MFAKNNIPCYHTHIEKTVGSICSEGTLMYFEKLRYEVFASNRMQCKILNVTANLTVQHGKFSTWYSYSRVNLCCKGCCQPPCDVTPLRVVIPVGVKGRRHKPLLRSGSYKPITFR